MLAPDGVFVGGTVYLRAATARGPHGEFRGGARRMVGHDLWTPTYTGLGERAHLGHADVSLDTHIQDIVAVLEIEDLNDVILIGHSYGGMVATGVADRARTRIKHLVYLDAFAPTDGQAVF